MKPLIVFIEKEKDGTINLTKDELEKMLTEAYEQGRSDGATVITAPAPSIPIPNWRDNVVYCSDGGTST